MKPTTAEYSVDPSYEELGGAGVDPFFLKLTSSPKAKCSQFGSKLKNGCCAVGHKLKNGYDNPKPLLKRVGILLAFHLLSALLGVGGVIFAALVLAAIAFWLVLIATGAPIVAVVRLLQFLPKSLRALVVVCMVAAFIYAVVLNGLVALWVYCYPFVPCGAVVGMITLGGIATFMLEGMIEADVSLANIVKSVTLLTSEDRIQAFSVHLRDEWNTAPNFAWPRPYEVVGS